MTEAKRVVGEAEKYARRLARELRMGKDLIELPEELVDAVRKINAQPEGFYSEHAASWLTQALKEFQAKPQEVL